MSFRTGGADLLMLRPLAFLLGICLLPEEVEIGGVFGKLRSTIIFRFEHLPSTAEQLGLSLDTARKEIPRMRFSFLLEDRREASIPNSPP